MPSGTLHTIRFTIFSPRKQLLQRKEMHAVCYRDQNTGQPHEGKLCHDPISRFIHEIAERGREGEDSDRYDGKHQTEAHDIPGNGDPPWPLLFSETKVSDKRSCQARQYIKIHTFKGHLNGKKLLDKKQPDQDLYQYSKALDINEPFWRDLPQYFRQGRRK